MAGEKLTQRTVTTSAADNDLMHIVDVSDTTDSPEGTSKQITKANFASDITPTASQILTAIKTVDGPGSGLNADLLDGQHGSYFYPASNPNGYTNDQTPAEILTAIKTVDGSGSGLDADTLRTRPPSTSSTANTIVERDSNGDIFGDTLIADSGYVSSKTLGVTHTCNMGTSGSINNYLFGGSSTGSINSMDTFLRVRRVVDGGLLYQDITTGGTSYGLLDTSASNQSKIGTLTAAAFFENSDERLKTNIKDYEPKEIKVNWKEYQLKNQPLIDRIGVSAQELLKTNPKFVNTDDDNSYTVNYIDLLCAKMAEKDEQIARLEAKVELLIKELL